MVLDFVLRDHVDEALDEDVLLLDQREHPVSLQEAVLHALKDALGDRQGDEALDRRGLVVREPVAPAVGVQLDGVAMLVPARGVTLEVALGHGVEDRPEVEVRCLFFRELPDLSEGPLSLAVAPGLQLGRAHEENVRKLHSDIEQPLDEVGLGHEVCWNQVRGL